MPRPAPVWTRARLGLPSPAPPAAQCRRRRAAGQWQPRQPGRASPPGPSRTPAPGWASGDLRESPASPSPESRMKAWYCWACSSGFRSARCRFSMMPISAAWISSNERTMAGTRSSPAYWQAATRRWPAMTRYCRTVSSPSGPNSTGWRMPWVRTLSTRLRSSSSVSGSKGRRV